MRIDKSSCILFKVIITMFLGVLLLLPSAWGSEERGAEDSVKKMNSTLLECMKKADEIGFKGRYKLLSPVIRDVFALNFMGKFSLGSHWKDLTPMQQNQFMDTYTDWTISSYAGNFDGYSGEKFEIRDKQESFGDKVSVVSSMFRPREENVDFHYYLQRFQNKWRIVDIKIEGVSQLAMTRGQFVSVLKKHGFDGLIASLKEKIALLHNKETKGK